MQHITEHRFRTTIIVMLTVTAAASLQFVTDPELRSQVTGALYMLIPAVLDSLRVARKNKQDTL